MQIYEILEVQVRVHKPYRQLWCLKCWLSSLQVKLATPTDKNWREGTVWNDERFGLPHQLLAMFTLQSQMKWSRIHACGAPKHQQTGNYTVLMPTPVNIAHFANYLLGISQLLNWSNCPTLKSFQIHWRFYSGQILQDIPSQTNPIQYLNILFLSFPF